MICLITNKVWLPKLKNTKGANSTELHCNTSCIFFILSMEETLRTSIERFIPAELVKLFAIDLLKKERLYHLFAQRYSQSKPCYWIPGISKAYFAVFSSEGSFDNVLELPNPNFRNQRFSDKNQEFIRRFFRNQGENQESFFLSIRAIR